LMATEIIGDGKTTNGVALTFTSWSQMDINFFVL
jgi:hypothetical protein